MTLPPEDRDLIACANWVNEAGTSFDAADRGRQLARLVLNRAARAARAEAAPVVDEAAVDRAIAAVNAFGPQPMALEDRRRALIRAALEAALNPSREVGQ